MKSYLQIYNSAMSLGWASLTLLFCIDKFNITTTNLCFLSIIQGLAILEIIHAAAKLVKTPVATTAVQVIARLVVVVVINVLFYKYPEQLQHGLFFIGYAMVLLAWGIGEVFRYGHYFAQLKDLPAGQLLYLRYTLFIPLYPIGVTGELFIIWMMVKIPTYNPYFANGIYILVLILYGIFFPKMYRHMLKQRKKKLI